MGKIIDITIIFDGERLKFEDVKDVKSDSTTIYFTDKDGHKHTFHMVSYHIEIYDSTLPEKRLSADIL